MFFPGYGSSIFKYNKTVIRFGFCHFQNNQGLGKTDNPYLDVDYSGYTLFFVRMLFFPAQAEYSYFFLPI